jgi:hypothetical protein
VLAGGVATAIAASCSAPGKGALVLAISTDMQAPKDIDVVSVFVSTGPNVDFDYLGRVPPQGTTTLPATLAVVQPDNPGDQVRIRVIGFKDQTARVLRDVLTTVPEQQTALLRVPLDFLDDGSAQGSIPAALVPLGPGGAPEGDSTFDATGIASSCDFDDLHQTSINGECATAVVDPSTLAPYDPTQVYGSGGQLASGLPAQCFDPGRCFAGAAPVTDVDMTACTFALPGGAGANFNLALVTTDTGECNALGQCFVPLENDAVQGWTLNGNTVQMVPGICKKAQGGAQLFMAVGACPPKQLSNPVCEPGEVGGSGDAGSGGTGSGVFSSDDASDAKGETEGGTSTDDQDSSGAALPPPNPHGTIIVPAGPNGIEIVHIEDTNGGMSSAPSVQNISVAGNVLLVAEPPDLSQGVVATTEALRTLNNAATEPLLSDNIPLSSIADGGSVGVPTSVTVFADSTFSSVQMSNVYAPFFTCFTGGLHLAQNQVITPDTTSDVALNASPDGTLIATTYSSGVIGFNTVVTMLSPHEIYYSSNFSFTGLPTPMVTGRGAMAYDPTTSDTMLYAGPDGNVYAFSSLKTAGVQSSVALPGAPVGASVAYAPGGQFAVVATSAGLFTITVDSAGTPVVATGPVNPSYEGSDRNTYTVSGAQSIAITSDGLFLIALTDQPSTDSGMLLVMPIDTNGNVGAVGFTLGDQWAAANADVLSAY